MDGINDIKLYLHALAGASAPKIDPTIWVDARYLATELTFPLNLLIPKIEIMLTEANIKQKLFQFISQKSKGPLFDDYMELLKKSIIAFQDKHPLLLVDADNQSSLHGGSKKKKSGKKRKSKSRRKHKKYRNKSRLKQS